MRKVYRAFTLAETKDLPSPDEEGVRRTEGVISSRHYEGGNGLPTEVIQPIYANINKKLDCFANAHNDKMKVAFTLAEVLITLGVIGVISAITLPILTKSYQQHVTVNRLKETYSTLSQAFQRAVAENGEPINWTYSDENYFVENYIAPYAKIVSKSNNAPAHYYTNGDEITDSSYKNRTHYYLKNGTELTVYPYSSTHYLIKADINGTKGPNRMGRDLFQFQFDKSANSLSSYTFQLNGRNSNISSIKSNCSESYKGGSHCGAWIMLEGWKIPNGYPW